LCIRLPTNSDVRKTFLGTEVAADNRLIIVVYLYSTRGGLPHPTGLFHFLIRFGELQASCRKGEFGGICGI